MLFALKWGRARADLPPALPPVPFAVDCACGHRLEGARRPEFQVVRCPRCRRELLVFPVSPLVALDDPSQPSGTPAKPPTPAAPVPRDFWRRPIWAAVATVALLVPLFVWLLSGPLHSPPPPNGPAPGDELQQHLEAGGLALEEGAFGQAAEDFRAAERLMGEANGSAAAPLRRVQQLRKQAALMADLLSEPLPEVLRAAKGLPDRAWQEQFRQRYRGRAILFDARVQREPGGLVLDYRLTGPDGDIRLLLDEVTVFRRLPLAVPQRLLFGVRLADARRDPRGGWVVRLEPDGGVLITDVRMLAGTSLPPDQELIDVLRRQANWLAAEGK